LAIRADALPRRAFARRDLLLAYWSRLANTLVRLRSALFEFSWQPLHLPLSLMGLLALGAIWLMPSQGYDAYAYWAVDPFDPYQPSSSDYGAFRYAPPVALLMAPMALLPFSLAYGAWLAVGLASLWFLFGRWALVALLFPPVFADLTYGNVHVLYAAMIVAAWQRPGLWGFGLFTKVTPAVAIIWHVLRGEWASIGWIVAVVLGAVGVSLAVQGPGVWTSWFEMLAVRQDYSSPWVVPVPLIPRLVLAMLLVIWGARTDRRWTLAVGVCLAIPTWYWSGLMLAPLVAIPALRARHVEDPNLKTAESPAEPDLESVRVAVPA
jgi:hypothetical protein